MQVQKLEVGPIGRSDTRLPRISLTCQAHRNVPRTVRLPTVARLLGMLGFYFFSEDRGVHVPVILGLHLSVLSNSSAWDSPGQPGNLPRIAPPQKRNLPESLQVSRQ